MAYRNELIAIHGQQKFADEAWRKNKCHETTPDAPAATPALTPTPSAKGRDRVPASTNAFPSAVDTGQREENTSVPISAKVHQARAYKHQS